ncbi:MAG: hypothetical protein ACO1TE_02555 [Prosthecobacter sp.]
MKAFAVLLLGFFLLSLQAQQPAPPAAKPATPSFAGEWEIFIGERGTGIVISVAQSGNALTATYLQIPENNRYGIRPGFDFFTANTQGSGSMTVRKGDVTKGRPVEKEQAPFQFQPSEDGRRLTCVVQSETIRKAEREFQLVRQAQIKNLRLMVQGGGEPQPATQLIEEAPMVIAVEMSTATQRPVEITLVSGRTTLKLTAKPQEATASEQAPSGHLFTEVFVPTFADQLGVSPVLPPEEEKEEGREPTQDDWKNLLGMWKTVYRDEVLGNITGWADIDPYGRIKLSYKRPGEEDWKELKLRSARVLGEIAALPAAPAAGEEPELPAQPALPKLRLVFDGEGVTSTPVKPVPLDKVTKFKLDGNAPTPVRITAENIAAEVDLTRRTMPDSAKVTLELDGREPNGVLAWNWHYHADRGTARDRHGLGRVGVLLRMDGEAESSLGKMAGREAWLRQPPQIIHAYAVEDQLAIDPDTSWEGEAQPKYRVGEKTRTTRTSDGAVHEDKFLRSGNLNRHVFIVARNLPPEDTARITLDIGEGSGVKEYRVLARDEEEFARDAALRKAWKDHRAAQPPGSTDSGLTHPAREGQKEEGILALAIIESGAPPKPQKFRLNGAEGTWQLLYGDTTGRFMITRTLAPSQAAEGDNPAEKGEHENVSIAFVPERLHLSVRVTNEVPTIDHIDAVVAMQDVGASVRDMQKIVLKPDPNDKSVYLSPPIELVSEGDHERLKGQTGVVVLAGKKGGTLRGQVADDSGYAIAPGTVQAQLETTPAHLNALWKDAVKRASDLAGKPVQDWNEVARGTAGAETNVIFTDFALNMAVLPSATLLGALNSVTTAAAGIEIPMARWWSNIPNKNSPVRSLPISIGDHAAMLLLRTEFIKMMREKAVEWQKNGGSNAMQALMSAQKGAIGARQSPMSFIRVPVTQLAGYNPKSQSVLQKVSLFFREDEEPLLHLLFDDKSLSGKLRIDKWDDDFTALQWEAFKHAYAQWGTMINESISKAQNTADGDVNGLLKLTGLGFEPVVQRLLPKLMKMEDDLTGAAGPQKRWVPDRVARAYVTSLGVLGAAVQAQKEYSEADTKVVQMTAALASIALGNIGGVYAAMAGLAVSAVDAGYSIYTDGILNTSRREDLAFEIGAGAVLGAERAAAAEDKVLSTAAQVLSIGGSLLGVGGDSLALRSAIKSAKTMRMAEVAERPAELMKRVDIADPAALRQLSKADQAVLARYIEEAEKVALSGRVGDLTEDASKALTHRRNIFEAMTEGTEANKKLGAAITEIGESPALNLTRRDLDDAGKTLDNLVKQTDEEISALKAAKPADGSAEAARLDKLKGQLGDLKQRRTVVTTFQEPVVKLPPEIAAKIGGEAGDLSKADLDAIESTRRLMKNGFRHSGKGLTDVNLAATERRLADLAGQTEDRIKELKNAAGRADELARTNASAADIAAARKAAAEAPAELAAAAKRLDDLKATRAVVTEMNDTVRNAKRTKVSLDDLELLQGRRADLSDLDRAQVEKAILDAGGDWKTLVKKAKGSGDEQLLMHKVAAYRREIVHKVADEVIADVEKVTGKKLNRDAFGSANLSSDYDVAFRGPGAEIAVAEFNKRIRNFLGGRESGGAIDNNFYTDPIYNIFKSGDLTGTEGRLTRAQFDTSRQFLFQQMANAKYRSPEQLAVFRERLLEGVPQEMRAAMGDLLDQAQGANRLAQGRITTRLAERAAELGKSVDELTDAHKLRVTNDLYADTLSQIHNYRKFVDHLDAVKAGKGLAGGAPVPPVFKDTALGRHLATIDEMLKNPATRQAGLDALEQVRGRAIVNMRNEQGLALSFASEAYQTGDTINHVVKELQAAGIKVKPDDIFAGVRRESTISKDGYVNSFYENGANLIKELNGKHVVDHHTGELLTDLKPDYLEAAATKSAKYFVRQIDAAHMAGTDLAKAGVPDVEKLVRATVDLDAARDSPAKFNDVLKKLGWTHREYVERVLAATRTLDTQVVRNSTLMTFANDLASVEKSAVKGAETAAALRESEAVRNLELAARAARIAGIAKKDIESALANPPADPVAAATWREKAARELQMKTRDALKVPASIPADARVSLPPGTRTALKLPDSSTSGPDALAQILRDSNRHVTPLASATGAEVLRTHLESNRTVLTQIDVPDQKGRAWVRVSKIDDNTVRADDPTTGEPVEYPADVFRALSHDQSRTLIIDPYRTADGKPQTPKESVSTLADLDEVMPVR